MTEEILTVGHAMKRAVTISNAEGPVARMMAGRGVSLYEVSCGIYGSAIVACKTTPDEDGLLAAAVIGTHTVHAYADTEALAVRAALARALLLSAPARERLEDGIQRAKAEGDLLQEARLTDALKAFDEAGEDEARAAKGG